MKRTRLKVGDKVRFRRDAPDLLKEFKKKYRTQLKLWCYSTIRFNCIDSYSNKTLAVERIVDSYPVFNAIGLSIDEKNVNHVYYRMIKWDWPTFLFEKVNDNESFKTKGRVVVSRIEK